MVATDTTTTTVTDEVEVKVKARKTPAVSGKAKLKWEGDIAKSEGVEVGRRVQKADGWSAVVKVNGKNETLAVGVSQNTAYGIVTKFYHYGTRPVAKVRKTAPVKKTA